MPIGTPSVPYRLPGSQMERWVDIYTRLGVERILFLGSEVNDGIANSLVAQMLYLDSEDSSKPIYLYINSPGGSVTAGLAIYDTIQYVKSEVVTICVGLAASMGAFLLAAGTKGKRVALPHSRIMIHQPLGGTSRRQASDIEIEAREILRMKEMLNRSLADMSGQSFEKIEKDQGPFGYPCITMGTVRSTETPKPLCNQWKCCARALADPTWPKMGPCHDFWSFGVPLGRLPHRGPRG